VAKYCPQCHSFEDATLEFCPRDGALLQTRDAPAGGPTHAPEVQANALVGAPVEGKHPGGEAGGGVMPAAGRSQSTTASEDDDRHQATMMLVLPEGGIEALRSQGAVPTLSASSPKPAAPAARPAPAPPRPRPAGPAGSAPAPSRPITSPTFAASPTAPKPAAPKPAAAPAKPTALPGQSSLRDFLTRTGLPPEKAVAKIELVARAVAKQRTDKRGALTPEHIRFDKPGGMGTITVVGPDDVAVDPQTLAYYRAPDFDRNDLSVQTDVYALGCMLFEALTGRPPFRTGTPDELQKRHAGAAPPAVRQIRKDCELPPGLELELHRALKKRPGDRHHDAISFAVALGASMRDDDRSTMALQLDQNQILQLMGSVTGDGQPAATSASKHQQKVPAPAISIPPEVAPPAKSKTGLIVGAVVGLAVVAGGAFVVLGQKEPAPAVAAAPVPAEPTPSPAPDVVEGTDASAPTDIEAATDVVAETDVAGTDVVEPDVGAEPKHDPRRPRPVAKSKPGEPEPKPVVKPVTKPDNKPDPNRPVTF
jgi:hypothetical protein